MMATGYVHPVADGKITSLRAFVLQCARGMGACIMMRDEPFDAPIPEAFEPSTKYHDEAIAKARTALDELAAMDAETMVSRAAEHYEAALKSHVDYAATQSLEYERVRNMRREVADWTTAAEGIKAFMLEQLDRSLEGGPYSPEPPVRQAPADWHECALAKASRDLAYHETERAKEIARTVERNEWLAKLRASLPAEGDA